REGDVAIAETQRLSRDLVLAGGPDSRATKDAAATPARSGIGVAATVRAATANDLADELEPGTSSPRAVRKGSSKALWIALVLLVAGGGATAAALLMRQDEPAGYKSVTR